MEQASNYNSYLEIDLQQLSNNFQNIRKTIDNKCKICCVVKANAYGHGAVQVSKLYESLAADYLAVSNVDEAIEIRLSGVKMPILILGHSPVSRIADIEKYSLTQTIASFEYFNLIKNSIKNRIKAHIKINSGMNRIGFLPNDKKTLFEIKKIFESKKIDCEGIFTHFASNGTAEKQFSIFISFINFLKEQGLSFRIRHCCNSDAIVGFKQYHLDMVRPGIALYRGLNKKSYCMSLRSRITSVTRLKKGSYIGYDGTYKLDKDSYIAVVPIGYGDGLPRILSNKGVEVLIKGKRFPIVGNICMDQCMIDMGDEHCALYDDVVLFGYGGTSIAYIAEKANTIEYEIMCNMNERLNRLFK